MSERVDHSNYEAWLLDRLEGNLTPEQERELDAFLLLNPDLAPADDALPTIGETVLGLTSRDREALKRTLPPTGLPQEPIDDFLIARLEGDLTSAQAEALRAYLIDHPEHRHAERLYALTKLVPEAVVYVAKQQLQRSFPPAGLPTRHTLDDFLVARLEGDLSDAQEAALSAWITADPAAQRAWALMQRTRMQAAAVAFADKAALKRRGKVVVMGAWAQRLAMAASVALLLGIGWWLAQGGKVEQPGIAGTEKPTNPDPVTPVTNDRDSAALPVEQPAVVVDEKLHAPNTVVGKDVTPPPAHMPEQRQKKAPAPMHEVAPAPFLAQGPGPKHEPDKQVPQQVTHDPVPEAPALAHAPAAAPAPTANTEGTTVGGLLASTFREKVLEEPAPHSAPLDADDAIAAVDKGLKAVAGDKAGLSVQRRGGRVSGFDLRLGRNLAIAANR